MAQDRRGADLPLGLAAIIGVLLIELIFGVVMGLEGVLWLVLNWVILLAAVALVLAFWLGSLVEALVVPDQVWRVAGQTKALFVVLIVLLSLLGTVLHLAISRPALRRAASTAPTAN